MIIDAKVVANPGNRDRVRPSVVVRAWRRRVSLYSLSNVAVRGLVARSIAPCVARSIAPCVARSIAPCVARSITPCVARSIAPCVARSIAPCVARLIAPTTTTTTTSTSTTTTTTTTATTTTTTTTNCNENNHNDNDNSPKLKDQIYGSNYFKSLLQSTTLEELVVLPVGVRCHMSVKRCLARDARCHTMSHLTADAVH